MNARDLRVGVVVFLAVFLGGLGLAGASALWSQQSTVTATVTTGVWGGSGCTAPGGPLGVTITQLKDAAGQRTFRVSWNQPAGNPYQVSIAVTGGSGLVVSPVGSVSSTTGSVEVVVKVIGNHTATFSVSIAAVAGGVAGQPTTTKLTVTHGGGFEHC